MEIDVTEQHGLRLLRFGTPWCQGVMRLDAPDQLELEYAVRMFAWLLFHDPAKLPGKHLVTLGLGAGSLTRFAHRVLGMRATAVEIEVRVIEACRTHFMLPPDGEGLQVVYANAADFIATCAARTASMCCRWMHTTLASRSPRWTASPSTPAAAPACARAAPSPST